MNRKLLIGIIVVFVIAAAILRHASPSLFFAVYALFPPLFLAVWIYLASLVSLSSLSS